jgi:hypothetical protein
VDRARVWFVSTLLFALLHLPNWVFGAGPVAVVQVFTAFFAGSMLYLTRRVTGALIPAMLLHGLWDFSAFIGDPAVITSALQAINTILALVLVLVLLLREKGSAFRRSASPFPTHSLPLDGRCRDCGGVAVALRLRRPPRWSPHRPSGGHSAAPKAGHRGDRALVQGHPGFELALRV